VDVAGFEPATFRMRTERSPSEPHAHLLKKHAKQFYFSHAQESRKGILSEDLFDNADSFVPVPVTGEDKF
jgi:hypothetical protein